MATATLDRLIGEGVDIRRKAEDAFQQVAHDVRVLKTRATDAVEEGIDEAAHRIKREPFKFVGFAFAIGVPVGALLGWACSRFVNPPRRAGDRRSS